MPVAEHRVELLQVVERGAGRLQHVAAVVAKDVLLQREVLAGGGHELPHARGARARDRLRIERAFDERQQRQLGRHAAALELFDDVEHVAAAAFGHALHVVGPRRVPLLAVAHEVGVEVGHREALSHAHPQVGLRCAVVEVDPHLGSHRVDRDRCRRDFGFRGRRARCGLRCRCDRGSGFARRCVRRGGTGGRAARGGDAAREHRQGQQREQQPAGRETGQPAVLE